MPEKFNIESIPPQNIIDVKISGAFYGRIHQLLLYYCREKSPEDIQQRIATLDMEKPRDDFDYHLGTILTMVLEIEKVAKEQGKVKVIEFTPPETQ